MTTKAKAPEALKALTKDTEKALVSLAKRYTPGKVFNIKNQKQANEAVARREALGAMLKEIDAQIAVDREKIIDPLRAVLDEVYKRHREIRAPILDEDKAIKGCLEKYETKQAQKRIAAAKKVAEKRGLDPEFAATQAVLKDSQSDANTRNVWDYEVKDFSKIPPVIDGIQVMDIKRSKLLAVIRGKAGKIDIPGLKVFLKKEVRR